MSKVKTNKNKPLRQVDFIDAGEKMDPLINKSNKRSRIHFDEQLDLSSMNSGSFEKATDVDENDSYMGLTPKTPKDENYYVYANPSHSHNVSTPGTVVSDFELDRLELDDVENSYGKDLPKNKLITLSKETKNNLLNETMLFMTLENEKLKKLKKIKLTLEKKKRLHRSLKSLMDSNMKIKIPSHIVSKYKQNEWQAFEDTLLSDKNQINETLCKNGGNKIETSKKIPKLTFAKQRKNSNAANNTSSINSALSSNAYIRGSGIVGKDSFDKLVYKRSDGILVNLRCSICFKDDFVSPQGIINHYRFKHGNKQYSNQAECILDNMEYYELLQSPRVLEKFEELNLDPKKSYLTFNVAFTAGLDLKKETPESLDGKVEFVKTLSLKKKDLVTSSGNSDVTIARKNIENEKENIIQVISLDNKHLKNYISSKAGNPKVVDEVNNFVLNFKPTKLETPDNEVKSQKELSKVGDQVTQKRKLKHVTEEPVIVPERRSRRKISIPKRLLD
ncbi:uncharacterized protein HGUI_00386 [Hanseniaspora guilliermondii]|uniref:AHC1-like C2H2 zinc-finger domain-containing protein n=1 Tax=Hanseniaspora guilliermondii TaxID=56406 RepID=A0A1L0AUE4_9ASCO|nr:uncharacterized protein HGUI_00386 [Hanseniaspora guilliermondii]